MIEKGSAQSLLKLEKMVYVDRSLGIHYLHTGNLINGYGL